MVKIPKNLRQGEIIELHFTDHVKIYGYTQEQLDAVCLTGLEAVKVIGYYVGHNREKNVIVIKSWSNSDCDGYGIILSTINKMRRVK